MVPLPEEETHTYGEEAGGSGRDAGLNPRMVSLLRSKTLLLRSQNLAQVKTISSYLQSISIRGDATLPVYS
jgi:hypothetical protein